VKLRVGQGSEKLVSVDWTLGGRVISSGEKIIPS